MQAMSVFCLECLLENMVDVLCLILADVDAIADRERERFLSSGPTERLLVGLSKLMVDGRRWKHDT